MSEPRNDEWMSRAEAAAYLLRHPRSLYEWERQGLLQPWKLPSGLIQYRRSDVEALRQPIARDRKATPA